MRGGGTRCIAIGLRPRDCSLDFYRITVMSKKSFSYSGPGALQRQGFRPVMIASWLWQRWLAAMTRCRVGVGSEEDGMPMPTTTSASTTMSTTMMKEMAPTMSRRRIGTEWQEKRT